MCLCLLLEPRWATTVALSATSKEITAWYPTGSLQLLQEFYLSLGRNSRFYVPSFYESFDPQWLMTLVGTMQILRRLLSHWLRVCSLTLIPKVTDAFFSAARKEPSLLPLESTLLRLPVRTSVLFVGATFVDALAVNSCDLIYISLLWSILIDRPFIADGRTGLGFLVDASSL